MSVLLWMQVGWAGCAGATWGRAAGRGGDASGGQAAPGIYSGALSMHRPAGRGFRGPNGAANR